MKDNRHRQRARSIALVLPAMISLAATAPLAAQVDPAHASSSNLSGLPVLAGRTVEAVQIRGNTSVPTAVILNVVRTRAGEPLDPDTVQEDYQRIFALRKFANVEANVEPTRSGVNVIFVVTEQNQIRGITFRGNVSIPTLDLQQAIDLGVGESIDSFRIAMARQAIERLYKDRNFPYAHVQIIQGRQSQAGEVTFLISEGPNVRVRNIRFIGRKSFSHGKLLDHVKTRSWLWILKPGTLDFEQLEDDVASLRQFYQSKGFFDARVGRKVVVSPDQKEVQIDFLIEEGPRYVVGKVEFVGNKTLSEPQLRAVLRMAPGAPFDAELIQRDIRSLVRAYSPFGFIYQPSSEDPDYLRIGRREYPYGAKLVYSRNKGQVDLIYEIHEGRPFTLGRILVKGNEKTQDKLALREMRMAPGQLYDSSEVQNATDRLRMLPYYQTVSITPIGNDKDSRDLLIEVTEQRTASFTIGAGINSNGGLGGAITYEQQNFDIANWPMTWRDAFSDRSWTGAGQSFRLSVEPGTEQTNASIRWAEPWLFDLPYSYSVEGYIRHRARDHYDEDRLGGRMSFGKRFDFQNVGLLTLRGEDVSIRHVEDKLIRAQEILDHQGHNTVTSIGLQWRHNSTEGGFVPYRGSSIVLSYEQIGAMGGEFYFPKFQLGVDQYISLYEDLLDRRTILGLHFNAGWIPTNDAPFFEKFYGGGLGSVRGFRYRGISPRSGKDDDAVGGNFLLTGSAEVSFPTSVEMLRWVVFTDVGTVEQDVRVGTIRSSIGAGIRLMLPFLGGAPLAIDFAYPLTKDDRDDVQYISFSFGMSQ